MEVCQSLVQSLQAPEFTSEAVFTVVSCLLRTVDRYVDARSRRAVDGVVAALAKGFGEATRTAFIDVVSKYADWQKAAGCQAAGLAVLRWSCILYSTAAPVGEPELAQLVGIQALVLHGVLTAERKSVRVAALKALAALWSKSPGSTKAYISVLSAAEPSLYNLCIMSVLMDYLGRHKDEQGIIALKAKSAEVYCKTVLTSKTKCPDHVVAQCQAMVAHWGHQEFVDPVEPALKRALLRSPETVLCTAKKLLSQLSIDLSRYAADLVPPLSALLHCKTESLWSDAAAAIQSLSAQCSDSDAVKAIVKRLFDVLNGSEGKLTVVGERISVLTAIGNVSRNAVTGTAAVQALAVSVFDLYVAILKQEVHEGTLVCALDTLSLWSAKFTTEVPSKLCDWFQAGLALKASTTAVRCAYMRWLNTAFQHTNSLLGCVSLAPMLLKTVEKAAASQPLQIPLLHEALPAASLLLRLEQSALLPKDANAPLWKMLSDESKQLFTNDKLLGSSPEQAVKDAVALAEKVLSDHPEKLSEVSTRQYLRVLAHGLVQKPFDVRRASQAATRRLLQGLGGHKLAIALLQIIGDMLTKVKVVEADDDAAAAQVDAKGEPGAVSTTHVYTEAVLSASLVPGASLVEAALVAAEALLPAHHPLVTGRGSRDVWHRVCRALKLKAPADGCAADPQATVSKLLSGGTGGSLTGMQAAAVGGAALASRERLLPALVDVAVSLLRQPEIAKISTQDCIVAQYPDGVLYDTSVLEKNKEDDQVHNLKRENKLYSHKDQLMAIELQKELEAKRGLVKLTKKQQEAKDAQLALEKEIRSRVHKIERDTHRACSILEACVSADRALLRPYLPVLGSVMWPLVEFPVSASIVAHTLVSLASCAFEDRRLGQQVAYCMLRQLKTACELPAQWCGEPAAAQLVRILGWLASVTSAPAAEPGTYEEKQAAVDVPLPAHTFVYFFPLLRSVLLSTASDKELRNTALALILTHTKIRGSAHGEDGPALLPRRALLELLMELVADGRHVSTVAASVAAVAVCQSASGSEGCAVATADEVRCLLDGLLSPCSLLRETALKCLLVLSQVLPRPSIAPAEYKAVLQRIWMARHDVEESNREIADKVWQAIGSPAADPDVITLLIKDVTVEEEAIHTAAAAALAAALESNKKNVTATLRILLEQYKERLYRSPQVKDNFGRVQQEQGADQWQARCGVATAIGRVGPLLSDADIEPLFSFLIPDVLNDRHEAVARSMRDAALAIIEHHGKSHVASLLPIFEKFLSEAPASASYDTVKQSVVILMGTLAKHLDKDDPRVKPIVARLIAALSTPSQPVQDAVANCLPSLVPAIKAEVPQIVQKLLALLLESDKYGERCGAAYGIAGVVKGFGILALKQFEIMSALTEAVVDKKNSVHREGALLAFEMLVHMLGRLFEPYVVNILPNLLLCFGDGNEHVRNAADNTSKAVMSKLSAHGVKLILPSLLAALEEEQWRTKAGSVELLGAMAYCAPKQLSACLPQIVPKLCEVLTDSHVKVQRAGAQALKQIGGVIRNPEIQAIVPILLEALQEPTRKTTTCLQTLLDTQFVHFIDAPSLALIMPVVTRAIDDRSTETRKMATQIIGNMYSLTDQKDLAPYMPSIMPGLKKSLLDPNPEVRTVSARALGAMVRGIGESSFVEELVQWLMQALTSDGNTVDRSGAAQGLSEVIGALGLAKLEKLMADVVRTADRVDLPPHVRDGYIMLYIYLPIVFEKSFLPFVGPILPSVLKALADENEYVRDTALKAGQRIINMYADTAVELLLPQLERGLFDENWRIRCSSVQLLGDLLYKLSGVSGKMSTETASEDDNFGTEVSQHMITETLGLERRNRVLSGLYMGRSDTALLVRQASLHVWKVVVSNTPRTLREIMPTLFSLLLGCLASTSYDKREVAARTLGDVVRKLGERVLPEILPILENGLESDEADQRQGVCIGLCEIMKSTNRDHILVYVDNLVPTVRKALSDSLPEVREAAAKAFGALHGSIGSRALDEILPDLLGKLGDASSSEYALDGLRQVMAVKSHAVLPYLVPQLTMPPVNTRALSFLSAVAGQALDKHLGKILPALLGSLSTKLAGGAEAAAEELGYCGSVVLSVESDAGLRSVMDELLKACGDKVPHVQAAAMSVLHVLCRDTQADYGDYVSQLFRVIFSLFTSTEPVVLDASWDCLVAVAKKVDGPEALQHVGSVRQALRYAASDYKGTELPGLSQPKKGVLPVLPIFREAILNGAPEVKEQGAIGLAEVINRSSAEALRQSVVQITGPLIRILGDRYSWNIKVALLDTIGVLLGKCGQMLKPFLPQLQTTFVKSLNDASRPVRLRASSALGKLIGIHVKVDPLFQELLTGIKNTATEDPSLRDTFLQALRECLPGGGGRLGDGVRRDVLALLTSLVSSPEDTTRTAAAGCLGTLCGSLPANELTDLLLNHMLDANTTDWMLLHARSASLYVALKESADCVLNQPGAETSIVAALIKSSNSDRVPIILNGYRGMGFLLRHQIAKNKGLNEDVVTAISKGMRNDSNDVKLLVGQVIIMLDRASGASALPPALAKAWIPMLVNGTKEKNTAVKANSEFALVALLRLRQGETALKACLAVLEPGMRESLNDIAGKGLRKVASQPEPRDEDIDDSILR